MCARKALVAVELVADPEIQYPPTPSFTTELMVALEKLPNDVFE